MTNDGDPFLDYGLIALTAVPEPSSTFLAVVGSFTVFGVMRGSRMRKSVARNPQAN